LIAMLVAGWTVFPGCPVVWTAAALVSMGSPVVLRLLGLPAVLWKRPVAVAVRALWDDLRTTLAQTMLSITLLVYHAGEMVRAIAVTLIRVLVTQRQLLEWETAASVAARAVGLRGRDGLRTFELEMAWSPLIGLALLIVLARFSSAPRATALPFVVA